MSVDDLAGRRIFITGAARGIGRAIADRLVEGGARVAIADIDAAAARAAAEELGEQAVAVRCDVRSADEVREAIVTAVDALGGLDGVVNNAGVEIAKPITDLTEDDFVGLMDINVNGTFRVTQAAVQPLVASGGGAIVNLSSVAGLGGAPLLSAYCASKGAVIRFTESVALELRGHGIRVNAICPGLVGTEMAERLVAPLESVAPMSFDELIAVKQGRLGTVEEVADLVAFLLSDETGFVTGSHFAIDGGLTASLI